MHINPLHTEVRRIKGESGIMLSKDVPMDLNTVPRVSILMAAYNAQEFLREALDDLLVQTFTEFELVVVDDGSTDTTAEILKGYAASDRRIVIVTNERNLGLPASLNRGLKVCRAPVIARADADDRYMPDRLERQIAYFDTHPEIGLLSCAVEKIDHEGRSLFVTRFPTTDAEIRMRELFVNCFSHPGAMFRRALVLEVGGYDQAFRTSEDADLWLRLRRRTKCANLDIPLVKYRKHPKQSQARLSAQAKAQSLGVRQRNLQDYLGREISTEAARAMVDIVHVRGGHRLDAQTVRAGMTGLREVRAQAQRREAPETVRYYTNLVHTALLQHTREARGNRELRYRLMAEAARWSPAGFSEQVGRKLLAKVGI